MLRYAGARRVAKATLPLVETHIVISGDTQRLDHPCGCAANQAGGLARRASLLQQLCESKRRIFLDAGGSASGTNEYQR